MCDSYIEKVNKLKSTRELTVRVPSLGVFVIDFQHVFSGRSANPD